MKKMLPIIFIPAMMMACTNRSQLASESLGTGIAYDTAAFAQFRAWQEYKKSEAGTFQIPHGNNNSTSRGAIVSASDKNVRTDQENESTEGNDSVSPEAENHSVTKEKKGWSKAAKGAAIGAGSGAVIGAVVNKRNRVVGAVVGGVVGGGVGYGIGRGMDKRDGRY